MATGEKFDLKKFFDFSPLAFGKAAGVVVKVGVVVLCVVLLKMAVGFLFGGKAQQYNTPQITAQSGSKVEYNVTQQTAKSGVTTDAFVGLLKQPDIDDYGYFGGVKVGYEW